MRLLNLCSHAFAQVTFHGVAEKDILVLTAFSQQVPRIQSALKKRALTRVVVTDLDGAETHCFPRISCRRLSNDLGYVLWSAVETHF